MKKVIMGFMVGVIYMILNANPSYAYTTHPVTVNGGVDVSCGGNVVAFLNDNGFWRNAAKDTQIQLCYTNGSMDVFTDETSSICKSIKAYANVVTDYGNITIGSGYEDVIAVFGKCLTKTYPIEGGKTPDVGYMSKDPSGTLLAYPSKYKGEIRFFISPKTNKVYEIELH